jgi:hypothetical protein
LLRHTISRRLATIPRLASVLLQFYGVVLHDMSQFVCDECATGQ